MSTKIGAPFRAAHPPRRLVGASRSLLTCAALGALVAGCTTSGSSSGGSGTDRPGTVRAPGANVAFDYQLGGAYQPPGGVRAVSRDRGAKPTPGLYNICYVNAFQTQPGKAIGWWKRHHSELLLKKDGELVVDEDWNEPLLDISTADKREALMKIVGPWLDGCAEAGFDAVEPDNLDSYERSKGELTTKDAVAFARLLAERAHQRHLAIAQKNSTDLLPQHSRIGFDFAVVEECAHYKECGEYAKAYDDRLFDIEYVPEDFTAACRRYGDDLSVTLRDRDVRPAGEKGYVAKRC
ncbi:endo alpha-1,4 polygalactosaminidase [Streptomyces axinellae]|uniref:Endo alpha-1,4 polygalactosaminidase n=1 Tax=Streptomyces axinellae TaxID=552788 RepID=A0ABP6CXQ1_9ACTN